MLTVKYNKFKPQMVEKYIIVPVTKPIQNIHSTAWDNTVGGFTKVLFHSYTSIQPMISWLGGQLQRGKRMRLPRLAECT